MRSSPNLKREGAGLSSPSRIGGASSPHQSSTRFKGARVVSRPAWLAALARRLRPQPVPLGVRGEQHAARYLRRQGFRILGRNVRVTPGEADLVALDPDRLTIVIVEVKTRLITGDHPPPEASITARKRRKLLAVAGAVADRGQWRGRPLRIDVIAIDWPVGRGKPALRHYTGAVEGGNDRRSRQAARP